MTSAAVLLLPVVLLLSANLQTVRTEYTILQDGIHIVSVVADPSHNYYGVNIHVNNYYWFTAYGDLGVVGGLDAAFPLKKGDKITMQSGSGKRTLGVVYASSNRAGAYSTAQTRTWTKHVGQYVGFAQLVTANQEFKEYSNLVTTFTLSYTGIYWVVVRLNCDAQQWATATFEDKFTAYCKDGFLMTVSGAYYLEKNRTVGIRYTAGNSDVQPATILSFVHLEGNNASNAGISRYSYMAFTAYADTCSDCSESTQPLFLRFSTSVFTDYGSMFSKLDGKVNIKECGRYVVAVRASPNAGKTVRVELHKNTNNLIFTYHAEKGYKSGQTAVLEFLKGDYLQFKSIPKYPVGEETLVSIALVWKA